MEKNSETAEYLASPASRESEEALCGAVLIDGDQLYAPVVADVQVLPISRLNVSDGSGVRTRASPDVVPVET